MPGALNAPRLEAGTCCWRTCRPRSVAPARWPIQRSQLDYAAIRESSAGTSRTPDGTPAVLHRAGRKPTPARTVRPCGGAVSPADSSRNSNRLRHHSPERRRPFHLLHDVPPNLPAPWFSFGASPSNRLTGTTKRKIREISAGPPARARPKKEIFAESASVSPPRDSQHDVLGTCVLAEALHL
jgi:hypothetical protein